MKRARSGESRGMPCAVTASERIQASVRPGRGIPLNALSMANNSRNAIVIARPPAPPVSTSVPSMSKRTTRGEGPASAFAADVSCARTLCRRFFLETNPLSLVELVETTLHGASVEEPLLPAIVPNEPKASVANESLDRTGCHPSRLLGRGRAQDPIINICSTDTSYKGAFIYCRVSTRNTAKGEKPYVCVQKTRGWTNRVPSPVPSPPARTCYQINAYFTVTVMT